MPPAPTAKWRRRSPGARGAGRRGADGHGCCCFEIQRTWNREDAGEWAEVYTHIFPAYQLLIESYSKAQDVVKNSEVLDSQR